MEFPSSGFHGDNGAEGGFVAKDLLNHFILYWLSLLLIPERVLNVYMHWFPEKVSRPFFFFQNEKAVSCPVKLTKHIRIS